MRAARRPGLSTVLTLAALAGCDSYGTTVEPAGAASPAEVDAGAAAVEGPVAAGDAGAEAGATLSMATSLGALDPAFSEDVRDYTLTAFTTLTPVSLTVRGADAKIGSVLVKDGAAFPLVVDTLDASSVVQIATTTSAGENATYTLHLVPPDLPAYTVTAQSPSPGYVYITPFSFTQKLPTFVMITSAVGDLLFYQRVPSSGLDFKKHALPGGKVRYTYIEGGAVHVLDERFRPLAELRLSATAAHGVLDCDAHDVILLSDDHYVLIAYADRVVQNVPAPIPVAAGGARVLAAVIQEVSAGSVVFEWSSTDFPELYGLSTEGNDFSTTANAADYAHLNSVEIDPVDGDFIASFRHLDAVLKVSRADGSIVWRLGGPADSFGTPASQRTSHQHFARTLPDGRLQIFDNGNASGASRVVTYALDTDTWTIESFESQPLGAYARAMGSAQRVGLRTLFVGLGAHAVGEPDVVEIDTTTGARTFELTFADAYYSYRAVKQL